MLSITKLFGLTFKKYAQGLFGIKVYKTSDFADIDYLPNYTGLKPLQLLQDWEHFILFNLSINFFVLPNNYTVSGVCNSDLNSSFISNTNLSLILLM